VTQLAVILAGGASRRMPGGKPSAVLAGTTLLARAVASARSAGLTPVVCARIGTALPELAVEVWREPATDGRPHPLAGIAWAVERAKTPIVVLPVDLPLLPPEVLEQLAAQRGAAVLAAGGRPAALVARVLPSSAAALRQAAAQDAPTLRALIEAGAVPVDLASCTATSAEVALMNINTPADLLLAAEHLRRPPD
jgi:molybdopterin-guanine dinucleotide biosynthesis protein A